MRPGTSKIAIPQFDSLTLQQDAGGRWHLETRFSHWRQSAARQYSRSFSDGALRLIGLLWSRAEGGGTLLLEEPELALHDALVRHLPRFMARMHTKSGRQVLTTTHSAALLADVGIGLDEVHVLAPDSQGTEIRLRPPPMVAATGMRRLSESGACVRAMRDVLASGNVVAGFPPQAPRGLVRATIAGGERDSRAR